ncbi:bifunctional metallophosphatase/5'-nucleotidase [Alicyclobacillus sp. TC]|nr:bifunctional metallophosphatase/5'-nucleotidase [Alicyclobacillus sp. TC]
MDIEGDDRMKIHLLHTNDLHSSLENYMRVGHRLRALRADLTASKEVVWTFDIGDLIDRVRPETEASLGRVNAAMMRALSVDAWVFGNNEGLTLPSSVWGELGNLANTRILCANLQQLNGQSFPFFDRALILSQENVTIGVFGLTAAYPLAYQPLGVKAAPPFETAKEVVQELRGKGCSVVICLSHLGLFDDRVLAQRVPGIDVILGGHTHHFMHEPEVVGHTYIFQAGKHGRAFGHVSLEWVSDEKRVGSVSVELVEVNEYEPLDRAMLAAYESWRSEIDTVMGKQVAEIPERLEVRFRGESAFANLLADALLANYDAHLSIMMSGALTASLLPGRADQYHLLGACSTPTRPVLMNLTGQQILSILEVGLQPEIQMKLGKGFGFRGAVIGHLAVAGAVIYTKELQDGQHVIEKVMLAGKEMNLEGVYRVATCEYLYLTHTFPQFQCGTEVTFGAPMVRELLVNYIQQENVWEKANEIRYQIDSTVDEEESQ